MSEIILLKDVEGIYVQWMFGDFKLFDGNLEVSAVGKRNDKDGVTYLVHYAGKEKDWRFGMASDELRLERLAHATEQPATAPDGGGEAVLPKHLTITLTDEQHQLLSRIWETRFHQIELEEHDNEMNVTRELADYGILGFSHNPYTHKYTVRSSGAAEMMLKGEDVVATLRAQLAAAEATAAGLREALGFVSGSLDAIQDYMFAPDAESVNAADMSIEERMAGMASQAMAANDAVEAALAADAKPAGGA